MFVMTAHPWLMALNTVVLFSRTPNGKKAINADAEEILLETSESAKNPKKLTRVNIHLEYFNTSSSKCILDIFKKLESIKNAGNEVNINWYYEEDDEDMLEAGEDYQAIIGVPFKMVQIEE